MGATEQPWPSTVAKGLLRRRPRLREWSDEDRAEVWEDLHPTAGGRGRFFGRFVTLSVLSTVLASLGLIANSIATLIAGMLLDPLMTPVLAISASILHGRPRRLAGWAALVAGGTLAAIGTGWVVAAISPAFTSANDLAPELLLRTTPDLIDLGVAVAAGISAGYVLTHRDASSVVPGVAVAVALVPPLAAVGVLLNVGATHEAGGAFLLYAANLGAIIVTAMVMLVVAGFVPRRGDHDGRLQRRAGFLVSLAVLVAIAVPLARQTMNVIDQRNFRREVNQAVDDWDPAGTSVEVTTEMGAESDVITVILTTAAPVPAAQLAEMIHARTGQPVNVTVEYRAHSTDTATAH